jgi:hypothetical protein
VQGAGHRQRELGDRRVELAVVGLHEVAALHRAHRGGDAAALVVLKDSPGRSSGCWPITPSPRTSCTLSRRR